VDLVAALIAFVAVRLAARPADKSHPYGHGKFENVSGTAEALLIFVGAGLIIYEAIQKLSSPGETEAALWGAGLMGISSVVNFGVSRYLYKVGRETDSVALQADAVHLSTDVVTSMGVLVGLVLVWLTGQAWLDSITAMAVALLIIKAGWDVLVQSASGLLDASLPAADEQKIKAVLADFAPHYLDYHELRTRQSGAERHIDFHLVVVNTMTVEQSHLLCNDIEVALSKQLNGAVVQIHIEPESVCTNEAGVYRCSPVHHFHSQQHLD
jgi:cation diffusion facilitator family transporter